MVVGRINSSKRLVFAALLALYAWTAGHSAAQTHKTPIRVGYLPATHDLLVFIAADQHFAEQEGLDLQLSQFQNSPQILQALLAQSIDVGIPGVAAPVMFISNGAPFHIIGGAAKNSAAIVVAAKYGPMFNGLSAEEKLKRFKGMRIGTVKQSTGDAVFRHALQQAGLLPSVDIREFTTPLDVLNSLKAGTLDAAILWSPHMSKAEAEGMPIVLWTSELMPESGHVHEHVCCRQVAQDAFRRQHRDALVKYMRALIRAMDFYQNSLNNSAGQERVLAIVSNYIHGSSPDILRKELYGGPGYAPRTTISVDLASDEIGQYVGALEGTGNLTQTQAKTALDSIDESIILDAYRSLGKSADEANTCVRKGYLACPRTKGGK
jgi:NitT/TauT family transport system substrate-binding protein